MEGLDEPFVWALIAASGVSLTFAGFVWHRRGSPGAKPLAVLAVAAAVWQLGYAFELAFDDKSVKLLWAKAQYPGIVTAPTAWLVFTLAYTGRGRWLALRHLALLSIIPVLTVLLAWTNELHGLIWPEVTVETSGSLLVLVLGHGVGFWVYAVYSYLIMLTGLMFLTNALLRANRVYWEQALALLLAALAPWVTNWGFFFGLTLGRHLDLTPLAFVISYVALTWALFRMRLLDITPVARATVFENMADGVLVIDAQGRLVDCNPAAGRIMGQASASAIGHPINQLWPGLHGLIEGLSEGEARRQEVSLGEGGESRCYDVISSTVRDDRGNFGGQLVMLHDTTDSRRREEQLRGTARLASIGELAAGVAHEINNPLTVVLGYSENLMAGADNKAIKDPISTIHSHADRAAKIVRSLLAFSRTPKAERRYVDLRHTLKRALELKVHDLELNNVKVTNLWPDEPLYTMADEHQMLQVLTNIIVNAEQAMVEASGGGELVIRASKVANRIRISVADDGPGISRAHFEKIFDPFFTTKEVGKGTGLGLSICHGIVEEHDGRIWAESTPGKGAEFHIEIPCSGPEPNKETREPEPAPLDDSPKRVMVVDDERGIRELVAEVLSEDGHTVYLAADGHQAFKKIRECSLDCVLLDLKMPGMSGEELFELIKDFSPDLAKKVVFTTGNVLDPGAQAFAASTGNPLLSKPFSMKELKRMLLEAASS